MIRAELRPMRRLEIVGGHVLCPDGEMRSEAVLIEDGWIRSVGTGAGGLPAVTLDAVGRFVLPGLVDIHGDAFERQIMPRPGVSFDLGTALLDTDRQLAANGITTAYHGITWSWETGLRSQNAGEALMDLLDVLRPHLLVQHRVHVRFETHHVDGASAVLARLAAGRVHLLAFNDHYSHIVDHCRNPGDLDTYARRAGQSPAGFQRLLARVREREGEVPATRAALAAACATHGVPMAAHDVPSPEAWAEFQGLGCTICEFPKTAETAQAAAGAEYTVVMGAPNVLRGGSHLRGMATTEMVAAGNCNVIASDYYYPALLQAPFELARQEAATLPRAWGLASRNAARAARLDDRGSVAPEQRADLVIAEQRSFAPPMAKTVIVAGIQVLQRV